MKIAILAKGPTLSKYPGKDNFDEVWGLNQLDLTHDLDRLYVMDDFELRLPYYNKGHEFGDRLKKYKGRLITSTVYPDWNAEAYPIIEIARHFGIPLGIAFYSTIDYMLAQAVYEMVDEIDLYGVDMERKGAEEMRCSTAMWIGVAMGRGIKVNTKSGSFFEWFCSPGICLEQGLYGYARKPRMEQLAGSI